jgi:hypothetical protein
MRQFVIEDAYGWPKIPESLSDQPLVLVDVDGTVRGEVLPMIRLARPMLPKVLRKVMLKEPWNLHKLLHFSLNLGKLWTLRTVNREQRKRYKHLFSELHHLAATLLQGMPVGEYRARYRHCLARMPGVWFDDAIPLLTQLTRQAVVILITGSEQVQTEECVHLLSDRGVDTDRIFVQGSLYGCDQAKQQFDGGVEHLNVTLDGKRDAVRRYRDDRSLCIAAALGNSRPDRALLEAVCPGGLRALVCSRPVLRRHDARTFVIRKFERSGYRVHWNVDEYLAASQANGNSANQQQEVPILATDCNYRNLLDDFHLGYEWARLLNDFRCHRGEQSRARERGEGAKEVALPDYATSFRSVCGSPPKSNALSRRPPLSRQSEVAAEALEQ